jgi:hypothetical protein
MSTENDCEKEETKALNQDAVRPRFHFTRFHKGTKHSGWEISVFRFCFKWMKFYNHNKYGYWRGANFGKIAMWNRSIEFTMPRLRNEA